MAEHNPHIINARAGLPWWKRALSDLGTIGLWVGWIVLWWPVLHVLRQAIRLHLDFDMAAEEVLDTIVPVSLPYAALAVLGTCALLLVWRMLPRGRTQDVPVVETLEEEAARLRVSGTQLQAGRHARIAVVHHDDAGQITRIDVP